MFTNTINKIGLVVRSFDYRVLVFVLILTLFVIGAGAPGATGINGG
jgi:hypothetical protein